MKIWTSHYQLKPRRSLSAAAGPALPHSGCLLKVEYPDSSIGYADLHPWKELGDAPLEMQLERLRYQIQTPLTRNALEISRLDAQARARGESLWLDQEVPENHYLMTEVPTQEQDDAEVCAAFAQGFHKIKIKVGRDPLHESRWINSISESLHLSAQLRLDFNGALNEKAYADFQKSLSENAIQAIDYVEDPVRWSRKTGFGPSHLRVALDRDVDKLDSKVPSQAYPDVLVIKPAINDTFQALENSLSCQRPVVFTSYLDHPLGQISAMLVATRAQSFVQVETCGLASQNAYESNEFSELLVMKGSRLTPPEGLGLGWDQSLERLTWTSL